jgi:hypothetical protein
MHLTHILKKSRLLYWGRQGHTMYIAGERGRIKEYCVMCDWIALAQNKFKWRALLWTRKWNFFFTKGRIHFVSEWLTAFKELCSKQSVYYLPERTSELSVDTALIPINLHESHATLNIYYLKKDLTLCILNFSLHKLDKLNNKNLHLPVNFLSSKRPNQPPI